MITATAIATTALVLEILYFIPYVLGHLENAMNWAQNPRREYTFNAAFGLH
jgi:hypothetical protein